MAKNVLDRKRRNKKRTALQNMLRMNILGRVGGAAFGISFQLIGMPVLGRLRDSSYMVGGNLAQVLSKSV